MSDPVIPGYGPARAFRAAAPGRGRKELPDLRAAIEAVGLGDGMTVSFHHHLRDGDGVLNAVMEGIAAQGLRDIHVAASSVFPVHAPLVAHIRAGVVGGLTTSYLTGPVAEAVLAGALPGPAVLQTHGGRAEAIASARMPVDVAFVAAPAADGYGNISGVHGPNACGVLGYPRVDVRHARHVVAVTDCMMPFPLPAIEIGGADVDHILRLPAIGDAGRIVSGTTRVTEQPEGRAIAALAARVIAASGLLEDGFSFQTGAGGISLAAAEALGALMAERGVTGSFATGGMTGTLVRLHRAGLFRRLLNVQCFDLEAVASYREDPGHLGISALDYAGPGPRGAVVDRLDAVILGAAEVDVDFNVNVTRGADGRIIGGSGGHADAAAGARLTLVTTRLRAGPHAKLVNRVGHVTTPGRDIDAVVTEAGVAVNPARADLAERLRHAGLPVVAMADLVAQAGAVAPRAETLGRIVAVSEYRDGSVIDVIRAVQ